MSDPLWLLPIPKRFILLPVRARTRTRACQFGRQACRRVCRTFSICRRGFAALCFISSLVVFLLVVLVAVVVVVVLVLLSVRPSPQTQRRSRLIASCRLARATKRLRWPLSGASRHARLDHSCALDAGGGGGGGKFLEVVTSQRQKRFPFLSFLPTLLPLSLAP